VRYRYRWMRTLQTLNSVNPELYREFMTFPDDLPDLQTKNAPKNTRPEGIETCYFALRQRGMLPATY
jgi:hypothetical protein